MSASLTFRRSALSLMPLLALSPAGDARGDHDRPPPPDCTGDWTWVEPVFETRYRTVIIPAEYETRVERVWIEPEYREERVRVTIPAVYETHTRRVWHPPVLEWREGGRKHDGRGLALFRSHRRQVVVRPGRWEIVTERVCVRPESWRWETRRVCVREGYWKFCERRVLVREACTRVVAEQVCVVPGRWERAPRRGISLSFSFGR